MDNFIHFYKHYYTAGIDIGDNRGIRIDFRCPTNRWQQYKFLLDMFVNDNIQQSLNICRPILSDKYGIDIFLDLRQIKYQESSVIEAIDVELYEKIVNKIYLPRSVIPIFNKF